MKMTQADRLRFLRSALQKLLKQTICIYTPFFIMLYGWYSLVLASSVNNLQSAIAQLQTKRQYIINCLR